SGRCAELEKRYSAAPQTNSDPHGPGNELMASKSGAGASALGPLVLRLGAASLLIYGHGWAKLTHFAQKPDTFPDPLHVGPTARLALAVLAEVLCPALVLVGFLTRWAAVPTVIMFSVIVFVHLGGKPFGDRELAMIYGLPFLAIAIMGPGRWSIDG